MPRHPGNTTQAKADLRFDIQHGFAKWTAKPHHAFVVENFGSFETPALNLTRPIGSIERGGIHFPSTSSSVAPELPGGSGGCMLPPAVLSSYLLAQTYGMDIDTNVLPIGSIALATDVPLPPDKYGLVPPFANAPRRQDLFPNAKALSGDQLTSYVLPFAFALSSSGSLLRRSSVHSNDPQSFHE